MQPISKPLSVVLTECGHFVITWSVQEYLCGHIGLNKTKHRNRLGISTLNSLLTVQFNVPKKCYEFKQTHFSMLFLMKLLFGFCLDFLLPKFSDSTASNL